MAREDVKAGELLVVALKKTAPWRWRLKSPSLDTIELALELLGYLLIIIGGMLLLSIPLAENTYELALTLAGPPMIVVGIWLVKAANKLSEYVKALKACELQAVLQCRHRGIKAKRL